MIHFLMFFEPSKAPPPPPPPAPVILLPTVPRRFLCFGSLWRLGGFSCGVWLCFVILVK